ncbi:hypothetical protein OM076_27290 [Solirubrobacter ginsenosidimutans]|uniref:CARDB domain-containing protein n=2 Tax=Solirubrobacter ginsenosidimutans TaxID=490573 RepID=A0A9X3MWY9_9ACTN|nr:hypothetical protein [Solirubrobacter ginsenosidimutans]
MARRGVLTGIVAFAAMTAPAQATIRQGTASDPTGDATGGAGYDITSVFARSDDAAGGVGVAIQTVAPLPSGAWYVGAVGTRNGALCDAPIVVFIAQPSTGKVLWSRDGGTGHTGGLTVDGTTAVITATGDPSLNVPLNCALGYTATQADLDTARDRNDTLLDLAEQAPPAATPTPTASPAPTVAPPAPPPAPTKATTPPVAVPKSAKLTISLDGAPATIKRNKTMTLRLKLANDGSKKSSAVTLSFGKARGLSGVSKAKKLSAFKPAQKRTYKLKVKLTKAARASTTLKVTAKAGKLKASSALVLRIGTAKQAVPQPRPEVKKSPIAGTFWWRNVSHVDYAWDNRALYFVDGGAVYSGFPKGGLPATCTTPVAEPDDEVDTREGCLPYTFDEKTGAVTIGDKAGTFANGRLTIDGNAYTPLVIPPAGTRLTINEQKHASFQGYCGFITGCTTSQEYLTLTPDGQFVLSRSTLSTIGDPGVGPYTAAGSYPPDQHGTYDVQPGGKIVLSFADGTVRAETFAYDTKDGAASPMGEGVFIGEDNYDPEPT